MSEYTHDDAMLDLTELRSDLYEANSAIMRVGSANEDKPQRAMERDQDANERYDRLAAYIEQLEAERDEALAMVRIYELEKMPCCCGGSWSNSGSTITRCSRCIELDAARAAVKL